MICSSVWCAGPAASIVAFRGYPTQKPSGFRENAPIDANGPEYKLLCLLLSCASPGGSRHSQRKLCYSLCDEQARACSKPHRPFLCDPNLSASCTAHRLGQSAAAVVDGTEHRSTRHVSSHGTSLSPPLPLPVEGVCIHPCAPQCARLSQCADAGTQHPQPPARGSPADTQPNS